MLDTPMLKRHLNPFLLASTVLILSLLAGLSVLYQGQLSELVTEKRNLNDTLEQKTEKINTLQREKANLSAKLSKTEQDLNNYIKLYKSEKQQRKNLESKVSSQKSTIENLRQKVDDLKNTTESLNLTLETLCETEANNLTEDSKGLCELRGFNP